MSSHILQRRCQERLVFGGLACVLMGGQVEGWTTFGMMVHLSALLTGTETSQVLA